MEHCMGQPHERSFGVFKPVGHVVISFPGVAEASAAVQAMRAAGLGRDEIRHYTDRQMIEQIDDDIAHASPLAAVGQELNLVRAHRALAVQGYHFLVVHVPEKREGALPAQQIADIAREQGALRAQLYGSFIIEELIQRPDQLTQVGESPDRGLDAQTPSGLEAEAGVRQRQRRGEDPAKDAA
jgi:hypothetical protein